MLELYFPWHSEGLSKSCFIKCFSIVWLLYFSCNMIKGNLWPESQCNHYKIKPLGRSKKSFIEQYVLIDSGVVCVTLLMPAKNTTGQQNEVTGKLQRRDLTFLKDFVSLITKIIIKIFSSEPFSRYSRFSRELGVFCGFIKIKQK